MYLIFLYLLAAMMVFAGVMHFAQPRPFVKIVPNYLPYPLALVYISGMFEILGGVGLLLPQTQRLAAWGLVILFIAVFPANIYMATQKMRLGKLPLWTSWARLPLQFVLIYWAWSYTR